MLPPPWLPSKGPHDLPGRGVSAGGARAASAPRGPMPWVSPTVLPQLGLLLGRRYPVVPSPGPGQLSPHLGTQGLTWRRLVILTLYLLPTAPLGSCKNSLLWGDLIWLCRMGTEEEEENLELEEVRGGFGPYPTLSLRLPLTALLLSTETLDRHAGDLIFSFASPPATPFLCHPLRVWAVFTFILQ